MGSSISGHSGKMEKVAIGAQWRSNDDVDPYRDVPVALGLGPRAIDKEDGNLSPAESSPRAAAFKRVS